MRVKVIRSFRVGEKIFEKDKVVNIEDNYAREVIASNKAEKVDKEQESSGPMTTKSGKGGEHAG